MSFMPPGTPVSLANLVETNRLSRMVRDGLRAVGKYAMDGTPELLPPGMGETLTMSRLGFIAPDLQPANRTGAVDRGEYPVEVFTGAPVPYAKVVDLNAPTAYAQIGDKNTQIITRLVTWAGMTASRLSRGALFRYCGGQSIVRRTQTTADSVLLVNSLAGFRHTYTNGIATPVSGSNTLSITIVAATTFTALVTGTTPLNANFPDGPGELTLSTTLSANVAAQSYIYPTGRQPYIVRPNARVSTETLVAGDIPTLNHILTARAKLVDLGVEVHQTTGTYHLHCDPFFYQQITNDTAFRQAFQGVGVSPYFGPGSFWSPTLGITLVESNDSPALGKGNVKAVGSAAHSGAGGTGTAGSSQSMEDIGIDLVSSTGVVIRRAIMTGDEVMKRVWIDETEYVRMVGGSVIHRFNDNISNVQIGSNQFIMLALDHWRLMWRPPLDERALTAAYTMSSTFHMMLPTDINAIADTSDGRPHKRAVVIEYGAAA